MQHRHKINDHGNVSRSSPQDVSCMQRRIDRLDVQEFVLGRRGILFHSLAHLFVALARCVEDATSVNGLFCFFHSRQCQGRYIVGIPLRLAKEIQIQGFTEVTRTAKKSYSA